MKKIVIPLTLLAFAAAPGAASARLACYPLKQIEQALHTEYGEKQQFAGRDVDRGADGAEGAEYRLYVNGETGSWSWVGIPAGADVGCLIFSGRMPAGPSTTETPEKRSPPLAQF